MSSERLGETGLTRRAVQWHVVTARERFRRALAKDRAA